MRCSLGDFHPPRGVSSPIPHREHQHNQTISPKFATFQQNTVLTTPLKSLASFAIERVSSEKSDDLVYPTNSQHDTVLALLLSSPTATPPSRNYKRKRSMSSEQSNATRQIYPTPGTGTQLLRTLIQPLGGLAQPGISAPCNHPADRLRMVSEDP